MKTIAPTATIMAFRSDFLELLKKHAGDLSAEEMLAVAAHAVGQMIAMQDQRKYSPETIMQMVGANIEKGNQEAIENVMDSKGSA